MSYYIDFLYSGFILKSLYCIEKFLSLFFNGCCFEITIRESATGKIES